MTRDIETHRVIFDAMACRCEILVAGEHGNVQYATREAVSEVRRIEAKYSRYRADSVVSQINAAAGRREAVAVDDETAGLLNFAARIYIQSDGLFDVTSGVLRRAWDFRAARIPSQEELHVLLALVGWNDVAWDGRSVLLTRHGMEVDFGGFGKEYAADRTHAVLARHGIRHGFINLGGDIRALGPRPDGEAWTFAIQHPRQRDGVCAQVRLAEGALATSGDYERFFITPEGRRCCHILDPRSGQPVAHWQSVSVVAPVCVGAGALSTMAMLMGARASAFLRDQGVAFLLVDEKGDIYAHDIDSAPATSRSATSYLVHDHA